MSDSIYLLTDFGMIDTYVAQMKAILLSGTPTGTILVDLTHEVSPGAISEGAYHLWASCRFLPSGSVVLAVVDPGVGSDRRAVAVRAGDVLYIGPDNGLFGLLDLECAWELPAAGPDASSTFHGRDVFAPAAARLICDPGWLNSLDELSLDSLSGIGIESAMKVKDGIMISAAHVDRFGNIILWLPADTLDYGCNASLILEGGRRIPLTRVPTYSGGTGYLLLRGSQGLMEIALDGSSAAAVLGIVPGERFMLEMVE